MPSRQSRCSGSAPACTSARTTWTSPRYPAPYCDTGYSLCHTARACKEKKQCGRKIAKCAKKVRKKPGKRHKCLKKWGKGADGACTSLKTQRKCPTSCGLCG